MRITITQRAEVVSKGKYDQMKVFFNSDGKDSDKTLVSFNHKDVYDALRKASVGDSFDVTAKKGEKYWEWVAITPVASTGELPVARPGKATGSWETSEERAQRQVWIMRQSSLSSAVAALGVGTDSKAYTDLAEEFFQYVLNGPEKSEPSLVDEVM